MDSKIELVVLNGHNYDIWVIDMETLLKRKALCNFTDIFIAHLMDFDAKFDIDVKKDEFVGVIMTYISKEINFHISGIDFHHVVSTKLKSLFNKINEGELIQIEK